MDNEEQLQEIIALVYELYGFDLRYYAKASLKRRILRFMQLKKLDFYDLKHLLINEPNGYELFIEEVTVNVTEMFRDPLYYKTLNNQVIPYLSTYPHIKIWSAGCSSGEEVYSLAILLKENKLLDKSFIYGTDVSREMLNFARKGIYSLNKIKAYANNYQVAGLSGSLTDNFTILYDAASIHHELKKNTLFTHHSLATDKAFNEFQMISCRNVFIYFETQLQEHVLQLFYDSLCHLGYLSLGTRETIHSRVFQKKFKKVHTKENIYQKVG
jgi:chemotaxis protein methyltransferase CheR